MKQVVDLIEELFFCSETYYFHCRTMLCKVLGEVKSKDFSTERWTIFWKKFSPKCSDECSNRQFTYFSLTNQFSQPFFWSFSTVLRNKIIFQPNRFPIAVESARCLQRLWWRISRGFKTSNWTNKSTATSKTIINKKKLIVCS